VDYHTFLLTKYSAIIWQQIVFVPLALIKLLSSIKTIVPIVVNTSLRTRTTSFTLIGKRQVRKNILEDQIFRQTRVIGEEWKRVLCHKGGMKSSKISKGRNATKRLEITVLDTCPNQRTWISQYGGEVAGHREVYDFIAAHFAAKGLSCELVANITPLPHTSEMAFIIQGSNHWWESEQMSM